MAQSKNTCPSLKEVVRAVGVVVIAVIVVMAGAGEHCMLVVFIGVHVVLIIELVIKFWMRNMVGLLFIHIMLVRLRVVSRVVVIVVCIVRISMVAVMSATVVVMVGVTVVAVVGVTVIAVVRVAVVAVSFAMISITVVAITVDIVMSVLIRSSFTTDVMCCDNAVLMALMTVLIEIWV